ncbi:hypothetical protein [Streptosporangium sp. NPDC087985]
MPPRAAWGVLVAHRPCGYRGFDGTNVKLGDPSEWAACQTGLVPTEE